MRQYNRTILILAAAMVYFTAAGFITPGTAYGEEPYYPAAPPVTQSNGYGIVPYAPHTPTMVTRPASWPQRGLQQPSGAATYPSGAAGYNAGAYNAGTNPAANYDTRAYSAGTKPAANGNGGRPTDMAFSATAQIKPVSDAMLLARVGSEVILTSDVLALIAFRMLGESEEPIPEEYRKKIVENLIGGVIETKLIYADVARSTPPEGLEGFTKQLEKNFLEDKEEGLPSLLAKAKVKTREELDEKLRTLSSSIEAQKRLYVERYISRSWLSQEINMNEPVTHEQMLTYYREHGTDFDHKARSRWEQLTIRFSLHPNKQEAFGLIAQAGNQVLQGVPFADVAKKQSEGTFADEGGQRDWITKGSLVSEKLDAALFGLPVGQLSQVIEDDEGFHIVRVVEREDAHRTPFLQAQKEIKKTIIDERFRGRVGEYLARLKKETMVWTVYDDKKEQRQNLAETQEENTRR